jgi:hypothetical protein
MERGETIDIILETGVLSFDGRVVEAFGFSFYDQTLRAHVAKLESVDVDPGGRHSDPSVTFKSGRVGRPITAYFKPEEAGDVQGLIDAVRAAAPQLAV